VLGSYAVAAVLLFVPTHIEWIVLLFPAWVATVSVLILRADPLSPAPAGPDRPDNSADSAQASGTS
jgi:hypothetical protein